MVIQSVFLKGGGLQHSSKKCHLTDMSTDAELAYMAKNGDEAAAELLFRRYQDSIYGYLLRVTRNKDLAADATQETFIRGFKGLSRYEEKGHFKSWLFRIAYNEGARLMARQSGQPATGADEVIMDTIPDTAPLPNESYAQSQIVRDLHKAINALPEDLRTVVHLRVKEDLSFKEIAEITGSTLNTSLGRMHNARKKLKQLMAMEA